LLVVSVGREVDESVVDEVVEYADVVESVVDVRPEVVVDCAVVVVESVVEVEPEVDVDGADVVV